MEQQMEGDYDNLSSQKQILSLKKDKLLLTKKVQELEARNRQLFQQLEQQKKVYQQRESDTKGLREYIEKQEIVIQKLNQIVQQFLRRDSKDGDISHSIPKTDYRQIEPSEIGQKSIKQRAIDQKYTKDHKKLDMEEQIIHNYSKLSNNHVPTNKLPPISDDKPYQVQILKSQLKKITPTEYNDNKILHQQ
ncbi:hypothetical protein pb186bvf_015385 [Paramecium bursaria]